MVLTDFETSELYLHGIWGVHSLLATAQIFNLHKEVVLEIDKDFELPPQWQVDTLANILFTTVGHDPTDNFCLPGAFTCGAGICAARMAITGPDSPNLDHVQGFSAMIAKASAGTPKHGTQHTFPRPRNKERPPPDPAHSSSRRDCHVCFDGTCQACGQFGHEAVQCDQLAMFLYLKQYLAGSIDKATLLAVELSWVERNKKWLSSDKASYPSKIAMAYLEDVGITKLQLDEALDWSFFEVDGTSSEEDE